MRDTINKVNLAIYPFIDGGDYYQLDVKTISTITFYAKKDIFNTINFQEFVRSGNPSADIFVSDGVTPIDLGIYSTFDFNIISELNTLLLQAKNTYDTFDYNLMVSNIIALEDKGIVIQDLLDELDVNEEDDNVYNLQVGAINTEIDVIKYIVDILNTLIENVDNSIYLAKNVLDYTFRNALIHGTDDNPDVTSVNNTIDYIKDNYTL